MRETGKIWDENNLRSPHDVPDKAKRVRAMFDSIAPTYELINSLFSAGRDAYWRRRAVEIAQVVQEDCVLDVACGTGDFCRAFAKRNPAMVVGVDFSHEMLVRATGRDQDTPHWCEADGLNLPFADGSFTIVSVAFGIRNFVDLNAGFSEMHRVLQPGGRLAILEFTRPKRKLIRSLYEAYTNHVMPRLASLISQDKAGAYRYLPKSIVSFWSPEEICDRLKHVGFDSVDIIPLTAGAVSIYFARRHRQ